MEEHTKNEQFQEPDEEQLQAITGASGSFDNPVIKLYDDYVTHSYKEPLARAQGNITVAEQHQAASHAALDSVTVFYPKEDSQVAAASPTKSKLGCFGCFGR